MDTTAKSTNPAVGVCDYSLIESDDHAELVEAVATACSTEGWFPQGGVCIWYEPGKKAEYTHQDDILPMVHYAQALVKYAQRE